jgi:hypothetical protein
LLAQGITFLLLRQLNVPNAAVAVRNWWSVYGTLVDLGCLELIYLRVRRLVPLIIGHWLMDLMSVLYMLQVG